MPEIVFALIFVVAFGLGPMPGVLAIMIHTAGALGKLFSEVVENIDMKPVEGIIASGGSRWQAIRYGVVPQVLPNFASYALLRFEINVRGASVMGFVGAGGIGQDLIEAIRKFYYSDVSAILLLIIATVMVIDILTERLRHGSSPWSTADEPPDAVRRHGGCPPPPRRIHPRLVPRPRDHRGGARAHCRHCRLFVRAA